MSKDLLQNPAKVEATYLLSFRRKNGTHLKRGLFHAFLLVSLTALMFVLPLAGRGHSMGELDASSDCGSAEVSLEYTPALARATFRVPGCKSLDGSGYLLIRGRLLRAWSTSTLTNESVANLGGSALSTFVCSTPVWSLRRTRGSFHTGVPVRMWWDPAT